MKKHLAAAAVAALALAAGAKDADPVLLNVDGRDVRVSEFEYLYNKNNTQQLEPQTLDQYLGMFIDYKLKVADAEHAGIPASPEFIREYTTFRTDLAKPYLRDVELEETLIQEAYGHRATDVLVSHIMIPADKGEAYVDSLRNAIVSGQAKFEDVASKESIDRGSSMRGGLMGYVVPGRFPWAFEKAAYALKQGEISPVTNSGLGLHIIRAEKVAPAVGEVSASHILLLTRGLDEAAAEAAKVRADSIYNVVVNGGDFAELAKQYSQDPGSAAKGGELGFFHRGAMVAPFDSACFAMADGEISRPVKTNFGYHIIKRTAHKDIPALDDEMRKAIKQGMARDERATAPERAKLDELKKFYKAKLEEKNLAKVEAFLAKNGTDSLAVLEVAKMKLPVASFKGGKVTVADIADAIAGVPNLNPELAKQLLTNKAAATLDEKVLDHARTRLAATNADYRNLLNEYRDGILLYEISNRNVWEKSTKDTEGLEKYFKANLDKYAWEKPKFKSTVIFATNDSVLNLAVAYADSIPGATPADFTAAMRKRFGRDIKIERVVAAEGENAITDYLGFGKQRPAQESSQKWRAYAAYKGRVIAQPEEAADVRGAAVTDYQTALDKEWVKSLHDKYKVKVNDKVFKKLKEKEAK